MNKISITKDISEHELNSFHDCVYDAIGKSLSHKELLKLFENLPENIQHTGLSWGLNDTVFLDNVYEYLEKKGLPNE